VTLLDKAWLSSDTYTQALSIIDETYGTGFVNQQNYTKDTKALVDEFTRTKDVDAFRTKLEELRDKYMPLNDEVQNAINKIQDLKAELNTLGSDVKVHISITQEGFIQVGGADTRTNVRHGGEAPEGRAGGGDVFAGTPYTYNEMGKEIFIPPVDGRVLNASQTRDLIGAIRGLSELREVLMTQRAPDAFEYATATRDALAGLLG
jgi:hypothetical protein